MSRDHDKLKTIKLTPENRSGVETRVKLYAQSGLKVSVNSAANMALREGLRSMNVPNPAWEDATHDLVFDRPRAINIKRGKIK